MEVRIIKYKSEKLLPEELDKLISEAEDNIYENHCEPDKVYLDIDRIRSGLIRWLAIHKQETT